MQVESVCKLPTEIKHLKDDEERDSTIWVT